MKYILLVILVLCGCTTLDPVPTGKDTYLIEGGVGLVAPPMTQLVQRANEFCAARGEEMTVLEWSPWVPGRDTPKLQFSCSTKAAPAQLRPDNGVTTVEHR